MTRSRGDEADEYSRTIIQAVEKVQMYGVIDLEYVKLRKAKKQTEIMLNQSCQVFNPLSPSHLLCSHYKSMLRSASTRLKARR